MGEKWKGRELMIVQETMFWPVSVNSAVLGWWTNPSNCCLQEAGGSATKHHHAVGPDYVKWWKSITGPEIMFIFSLQRSLWSLWQRGRDRLLLGFVKCVLALTSEVFKFCGTLYVKMPLGMLKSGRVRSRRWSRTMKKKNSSVLIYRIIQKVKDNRGKVLKSNELVLLLYKKRFS